MPVLDATGMVCPLPVLKARKMLQSMSPGEVLEVTATDPAAARDFAAFCDASGHRLIERKAAGERLLFRIRKSG